MDNTLPYQDEVGKDSCKACGSCGAGKKQTRACSPTANLVCGACPANTRQDSTSHTSTSCKSCPAGYTVNEQRSSCDPETDPACDPYLYKASIASLRNIQGRDRVVTS